MFTAWDILLTCDTKYQDAGGLWRTKDSSRTGLHCLLGNGTTGGPTLDANRGQYMFYTSYMTFPYTEDRRNVLTKMGSAQDETYMFLFRPIITSTFYQYFIQSNSESATSRFFVRINNDNTIAMSGNNAAGTAETVSTVAITPYLGRTLLITAIRNPSSASKKQIIYLNDKEYASGNSTCLECNKADINKTIGRSAGADLYLRPGTGLMFFGYVRKALGALQIAEIYKHFRSNM